MDPENQTRVPESQEAPANAKPLNFSLEAQQYSGAVVLHCQGRLIFRNEAHVLSTAVSEILPAVRRMVVDLTGVGTVDSAGLGELVLLHMWAEAAGYTLKFASPNRTVQHLLELTNLVSVFDVYSSVPEAVAAMHYEEVQSA